jgi:hypothetical protein
MVRKKIECKRALRSFLFLGMGLMSLEGFMRISFGDSRVEDTPKSVQWASLEVSDQWNNPVKWDVFSKVPKALVFGGKAAALESRKWGAHFQITFNGGYEPTPAHLQELSLNEKIKVIAVATLPEVPGMFKGLFRSGFRGEAKTMGIALDFAPGISQQVGYVENGDIPLVVLFKKTGEEFARFSGLIADDSKKSEIDKSIQALLQL